MAFKSIDDANATLGQKPEKKRKPTTFEMVQQVAPTHSMMVKIAAAFALEDVDYEKIRDTVQLNLMGENDALCKVLSEKALQMHLERITGAYVASAWGAANFYSNKATEAARLSSGFGNDDRDEDRDGVAGFENKQERARQFAAEMASQAYALMAAAHGAVDAYRHITGQDWKPYAPRAEATQRVEHRSTQAQMDAFQRR
ncbi:hypothetical protein [Beijerinckia indica]|uniref:Uncharacterized protein n=1 Tax=Beijerinckia indica subsp. indica (strain ATCC 9039 / DSM 1715 / NCIMB 8712) TaxID=395963 RepID=B2IL72_BEII9|nr:hypothetical protein [Beijerinckia indica]ACB97272.1 conserved hypothetical protein [Beijerinckia indica subsp. indica ATCC 9039]